MLYQPADYEYRQGWDDTKRVEVASAKRGAALMFEDFAAMIGNPEKIAASMHSTQRTQQWLDAIWNSALKNEHG
jgi:hypothetical protein